MQQIRLGSAGAPDPAVGVYSAPRDPLSGFKRPTSKRREGERKGMEREWEGREREGREMMKGGREGGEGENVTCLSIKRRL